MDKDKVTLTDFEDKLDGVSKKKNAIDNFIELQQSSEYHQVLEIADGMFSLFTVTSKLTEEVIVSIQNYFTELNIYKPYVSVEVANFLRKYAHIIEPTGYFEYILHISEDEIRLILGPRDVAKLKNVSLDKSDLKDDSRMVTVMLRPVRGNVFIITFRYKDIESAVRYVKYLFDNNGFDFDEMLNWEEDELLRSYLQTKTYITLRQSEKTEAFYIDRQEEENEVVKHKILLSELPNSIFANPKD